MKEFTTYLIITAIVLSVFGVLIFVGNQSVHNSQNKENPKEQTDEIINKDAISETVDSTVPPENSQQDKNDSLDNLANGNNELPNADKIKPTDVNTQPVDLSKKEKKPMTVEEKLQTQRPELTIDPNKKYTAVMKTTEGDIVIELDAKNTPITANNFIYLATLGFYDDTIFHRIIKGFMIQGGDPLGKGYGGPNYKFEDEKFPYEGKYKRGDVAMANSGTNTNGSQFFIVHQDTPLQPNYTIFGHVVKGLETVDKLADTEVEPNEMGEKSKPVNPPKIISVDILEQ